MPSRSSSTSLRSRGSYSSANHRSSSELHGSSSHRSIRSRKTDRRNENYNDSDDDDESLESSYNNSYVEESQSDISNSYYNNEDSWDEEDSDSEAVFSKSDSDDFDDEYNSEYSSSDSDSDDSSRSDSSSDSDSDSDSSTSTSSSNSSSSNNSDDDAITQQKKQDRITSEWIIAIGLTCCCLVLIGVGVGLYFALFQDVDEIEPLDPPPPPPPPPITTPVLTTTPEINETTISPSSAFTNITESVITESPTEFNFTLNETMTNETMETFEPTFFNNSNDETDELEYGEAVPENVVLTPNGDSYVVTVPEGEVPISKKEQASFGSSPTLLVRSRNNADNSSTVLPEDNYASSYALMNFYSGNYSWFNEDDLQNFDVTAVMCLEHIPDFELTDIWGNPQFEDSVKEFSICRLKNAVEINKDNDGFTKEDGKIATGRDVEKITEMDYNMPNDCINQLWTNFSVSSINTTVCFDITLIVSDYPPFVPFMASTSSSSSQKDNTNQSRGNIRRRKLEEQSEERIDSENDAENNNDESIESYDNNGDGDDADTVVDPSNYKNMLFMIANIKEGQDASTEFYSRQSVVNAASLSLTMTASVAPVTNSPTMSPTNSPVGFNPSCGICGPDSILSISDGILVLPLDLVPLSFEEGEVSCNEVESWCQGGFCTADLCVEFPVFVSEVCGCQEATNQTIPIGEETEADIDADGDVTTFMANGDTYVFPGRGGLPDVTGSEDTFLVQNGNPFFPKAYSLIGFDRSDLVVINKPNNAIFCLEHLTSGLGKEARTYSICIVPSIEDNVETLTGLDVEYKIPDSCLGGLVTEFDVSPSTETICTDVSSLFEQSNLLTTEESSTNQIIFMIDNLVSSESPGDKFFSRSSADGPTLGLSSGGNATLV